jgi:hypothetical protein
MSTFAESRIGLPCAVVGCPCESFDPHKWVPERCICFHQAAQHCTQQEAALHRKLGPRRSKTLLRTSGGNVVDQMPSDSAPAAAAAAAAVVTPAAETVESKETGVEEKQYTSSPPPSFAKAKQKFQAMEAAAASTPTTIPVYNKAFNKSGTLKPGMF